MSYRITKLHDTTCFCPGQDFLQLFLASINLSVVLFSLEVGVIKIKMSINQNLRVDKPYKLHTHKNSWFGMTPRRPGFLNAELQKSYENSMYANQVTLVKYLTNVL